MDARELIYFGLLFCIVVCVTINSVLWRRRHRQFSRKRYFLASLLLCLMLLILLVPAAFSYSRLRAERCAIQNVRALTAGKPIDWGPGYNVNSREWAALASGTLRATPTSVEIVSNMFVHYGVEVHTLEENDLYVHVTADNKRTFMCIFFPRFRVSAIRPADRHPGALSEK